MPLAPVGIRVGWFSSGAGAPPCCPKITLSGAGLLFGQGIRVGRFSSGAGAPP